jgi:hypothetical protein
MIPLTWRERRQRRKLERKYPLISGVTGIVMATDGAMVHVVLGKHELVAPRPGMAVTLIFDRSPEGYRSCRICRTEAVRRVRAAK